MKDITRILSRYICASRFDALPLAVRHEGARAFVNWLGCAAGGSREDDVLLMRDHLAEFNGAADTTVVGHRAKLDSLNAAFINSMSSGALAFNDTHFTTVAHPTATVVAVLLALAERQPMTGKDLLHALILGVEVQCRVGNILCVPPAQSPVGLSMKGLAGVVGAAVAAGKALGLDEQGMAAAIGHAANQAAGLREAQSTMASHFTYGHGARCGLTAALLARRGFECSDTMIEGPKGFAVSFATQPNLAAAVEKLGETFEMSSIAYKPYPSGFVVHPIIDACLEIARTPAWDAAPVERIERVELTVNPLAEKLTNRPNPHDRGQALVSFQHWAAVSLIHKAAGIAQVTDAVVNDPRVAALRRKVTCTSDAGMGREAAHARVILDSGKVIEARVRHCRGSVQRPLTDGDVSEKALAQLQTVYPPHAATEILAHGWRIGECATVVPLCQQLVAHATEN